MRWLLPALAALVLGACRRPGEAEGLDRRLGGDQLCAALRQSGTAAPIRIAAPLSLSLRGLARLARPDEPFSEVSPESVRSALPRDLGPIEDCRCGRSSLNAGQLVMEMSLEYPVARLGVTLRYVGREAPKLRFFRVGVPDPKVSAPAPVQQTSEEPLAPTGMRFADEVAQAYQDWAALDELFGSALAGLNQRDWSKAERDAAALQEETARLSAHLAEDIAQEPPDAVLHAEYFARAQEYAEALGRCAARLREMSGRVRARLATQLFEPKEALAEDLKSYKGLKWALKSRTDALDSARRETGRRE